MFGTVLFILTAVAGFLRLPPWVLVPFTVAMAFVGLHYPPGKADLAKARGIYWQAFFMSLPLMAIVASIIFGVAYGIALLLQ